MPRFGPSASLCKLQVVSSQCLSCISSPTSLVGPELPEHRVQCESFHCVLALRVGQSSGGRAAAWIHNLTFRRSTLHMEDSSKKQDSRSPTHIAHWFSPPDRRCSSPYYELPMPITKLRALLHFRMGSHVLPVEQGRFARPHIPRNLRRCTLCTTGAVGDERHFCFECPFFDGIRAQYADLYDSSGGAMRSFMWHKDQEDVSDCLTAILQLAET